MQKEVKRAQCIKYDGKLALFFKKYLKDTMHRLRDLWLLINELPILFDLLSKGKLAFVVGVKATIKLPSSSKPSEFSQYGCCTGNAVDEFSLSNPASPYMLMSLP